MGIVSRLNTTNPELKLMSEAERFRSAKDPTLRETCSARALRSTRWAVQKPPGRGARIPDISPLCVAMDSFIWPSGVATAVRA